MLDLTSAPALVDNVDIVQEVIHSSLSLTRALVLNSSYEPLTVISWKKALLLWLTDKVEILEYHSQWVSSPSTRLQIPSVLRLNRYVRSYRKPQIRFCRENIYTRDDHTCQYCRRKMGLKSLTLDHVLPLSRGGEHHWTNVTTACRSCNNQKGNLTPEEAGMPLMKKPHRPSFLPQKSVELHQQHIHPSWRTYLLK